MTSGNKILGIIGGMGPAATCAFFRKVVEYTCGKRDADHIEVFIHNNTRIPDRTEAIIGEGESPVEELTRSAELLLAVGVEVIVIPCITAHYFVPALPESIKSHVVNAVDETISFILSKYPGSHNVGILATAGTVEGRIFQSALEKYSLSAIVPSSKFQKLIMDAIYGPHGVKAGNMGEIPKQKLVMVSDYLISRGSDILIAGCTEIPLVLDKNSVKVPVIDPMEVLARRVVEICKNSLIRPFLEYPAHQP